VSDEEIVFEPMPGKIVCELLSSELETGAGLILLRDPNSSRIAKVIAVYEPFNYHTDRPDDLTEPFVGVGDLVIFGKNNGTEITVTLDGVRKSALVLTEKEIMTKVRVRRKDAQDQ